MAEENVLKFGKLIVTHVVTDYYLAIAYMKMLEDGTLDTVFFQSRPSISEFMAEFLTAGRRITLGCFREIEGTDVPELCGIGWVFGAVSMDKFIRAETGMCFFKRQSNKKDNLTFGQMMLRVFFTSHKIDAIFGTTPDPNKLALRYAQKLGMDLIGPVPDYCSWKGELVSGWISHISREQWLERNR